MKYYENELRTALEVPNSNIYLSFTSDPRLEATWRAFIDGLTRDTRIIIDRKRRLIRLKNGSEISFVRGNPS